jgi:dTDP-4-amino-4,6-dideoxygalactose transaminase
MLYGRHGAGPKLEVYSDIRCEMPNCSARMDALRAAILRPQLADINQNIARWNARYRRVEAGLRGDARIAVTPRLPDEDFVGSSIQFRVPELTEAGCQALLQASAAVGVELKWFGNDDPVGFTSAHQSWSYVARQLLPQTDAILATLFDMRLPLTFSEDDCTHIAAMIIESLDEVMQ